MIKNLLLIAISAALAEPAIAAQKTAPVQEIKVSTQTQEVPVTSSEVIKRLSEWDRNLESLQASFTQTVSIDSAGSDSVMQGKIHYLKPNHLRIEHSSPQRQIVYTDKDVIWIYKPADAQVVKARWAEWMKQQSASLTGVADFGSYSSITDKHKLSVSEDKAAGLIRASFTPKDNPKLYTLTLVLSKADYFPVAIEFSVGKTRIATRLEQVERNGKIPAGIFEFKPPEGVSEINFY